MVAPPSPRSFPRDSTVEVAPRLEVLDVLDHDGAVVLTGVEPTLAGLRGVAGLLGEIRATNYGVEWEIRASQEPTTPVDGQIPLRVHTDLPYRDAPPGLQILLSVEAGAEGGVTTLVDGYAVAEELRRRDPAAWATLTEVEWTMAYTTPTHDFIGGGPLIGLDRSGRHGILRHAPDLTLPLRDAAVRDQAMAARDQFMAISIEPEFESRLLLGPGEALVFDNHRMMHGRTPVDLRTGGRVILGCYCELDDLAATRRHLRRALARN